MIYTRIVFVIRLTAIGDVLIAARSVHGFLQNGYFPIFVTSFDTIDVAKKIVDLKSFICIDKEKKINFFIHNEKATKSEFNQFLNGFVFLKNPILLDLQRTSRSKIAVFLLKNSIQFVFEKKIEIEKRTIYRIFLIILSFLCFSQKINLKKNIDIKRIHDIQEEEIRKIVESDKKIFIKTENISYLAKTIKSEKEINIIRKILNDNKYVCIFPGASGFIKKWPKENVKDLIAMILEHTDFKIFICGSKQDLYLGEYLSFPPSTRVLNLVGFTTLGETLDLISNAHYVVANDSFAIHAADAFQVPASVLFGPTSPEFGFVPIYGKIKVVYKNLKCSPCSRHGKGRCRYENLHCLKKIEASEVFKNIA